MTKKIRRELFNAFSSLWSEGNPRVVGEVIDSKTGNRANQSIYDLLKVPPASRPALVSHQSGSLRYASVGEVSRQFIAKGSANSPPFIDAGAGLVLGFKNSESILFDASGCTVEALPDVTSLEAAILSAFEKGDWKENYVLVSEVVKANAFVLAVSSKPQSLLELKINGSVDAAAFSLSDAAAEIVANAAGSAVAWQRWESGTPFFRGWRVGGWFTHTLKPLKAGAPHQLALSAHVGPDDLP
jgi:hypothetical protein